MQKVILLIEDEELVRESISDLLKEENFKVFTAANGTIGISLAEEIIPDLILCDINMPVVDGYEVLTQIKNNTKTQRIPFIFLTAQVDYEKRRKGMELGADDFLNKPFKSSELYKAINARFKQFEVLENNTKSQIQDIKAKIAVNLQHEFRTPLNGILATSQYLVQDFDNLEIDEIKVLQNNVYISALRLKRLINNYLFFSELILIDNLHFKSNCDFSLNNYFGEKTIELINQLSDDYQRKNSINYYFETGSFNLEFRFFIKIIEELLDNALKFSEKDTDIKLIGSKINNEYVIHVIDQGIGMDEIEIKNVDAFNQFKREIFEKQGSGLGLAIVKKICDLINGTFEIVKNPIKGITVKVTIPIQ